MPFKKLTGLRQHRAFQTALKVLYPLLLIVFIALFLVNNYAHHKEWTIFFKVLSTGWVMLLPILLYRERKDRFILMIIIALVFGIAGDFLMELNFINFLFFGTGLLSFMVQNLIYLAALAYITPNIRITPRALLLSNLYILANMLVIFYLLEKVGIGQVMAYPLTIYMAILINIFLISLYTLFYQFSKVRLLFVLGSLFFIVSDILLAFNQFAAPFASASFWNAATYYPAQFCFALSCFYFHPRRHDRKRPRRQPPAPLLKNRE